MTLNFKLASWILFAAYLLVVIIIFATLFINPNIDDQVGLNNILFTENTYM